MSDNGMSKSDLDKVQRFEQALLSLPQVDMQTASLIHGKMYARTIFIPAGTAVTGTLTKLDNICVVSGDITVTTDNGMQRLVGFHVLPASKGYKRVGYAHADTYWTTLIQTDAATVEQAEDAMTDEAANLQTRRTGIEYDWNSKARSDYGDFIREYGLPLEFIDAWMRRTDDLIETEACYRNMAMSPSPIHGIGVFANRDIKKGERIAPARRDGHRCVAGRFTNHSHEPNAQFVATGIGDHVDMVAIKQIKGGREITVDYRVSGLVAHAIDTET
jgi:hypothetical protein